MFQEKQSAKSRQQRLQAAIFVGVAVPVRALQMTLAAFDYIIIYKLNVKFMFIIKFS